MTRRSLLLLLAPALFACANPGGPRRSVSSPGVAAPSVRVSVRDYRNGIRFSIVNDGLLVALGIEGDTPDLRRAAFYSDRRSDLMSKVVPDDVMGGILQFLDGQGFSRQASEGPAPPEQASAEHLSTSIEVVVDGRAKAWLFDRAWTRAPRPPRVAEQYLEASNGLLAMHQRIEQYQAADAADLNFDARTKGRR